MWTKSFFIFSGFFFSFFSHVLSVNVTEEMKIKSEERREIEEITEEQ